jgi:RimJ/RimL family protein N-acetyltransferase
MRAFECRMSWSGRYAPGVSFRNGHADAASRRVTFGLVDVLETDRLMLEQWHARRRDSWRAICQVPEVMRYIGGGEFWSEAEADEVFDWALGHWREHGFGWRGIVDRADQGWLGFVGLNHPGPRTVGMAPEEVEIGWWLVPAAWGRGIATEGALKLTDEAFGRLGLDQIIARVRPENAASIRVTQKLGMEPARQVTGRYGEAINIYELSASVMRRSAPPASRPHHRGAS